MAALRSLASPTARVLRNGVLGSIASGELVPGDLVFLEEGVSLRFLIILHIDHSLTGIPFILSGSSSS